MQIKDDTKRALLVIYLTVLTGTHFFAYAKVGNGLDNLLIIDEKTKSAYAMFQAVQSNYWIGPCYILTIIIAFFYFHRAASPNRKLKYILFIAIIIPGIIYAREATYLGCKMLRFQPQT